MTEEYKMPEELLSLISNEDDKKNFINYCKEKDAFKNKEGVLNYLLNKFSFEKSNHLCKLCIGEDLIHTINDCDDENMNNFIMNVYFNVGKTKIKLSTISLYHSHEFVEDELTDLNQVFNFYQLNIEKKYQAYDVIVKNIFNGNELKMKKFFIMFWQADYSILSSSPINDMLQEDFI